MKDEPTPELRALAAKLFAAGRAERPGPALGRRLEWIDAPQRLSAAAPTTAPRAAGRKALVRWLAAAIVLASGAGLWLAREPERQIRISAEHAPGGTRAEAGESAGASERTAAAERAAVLEAPGVGIAENTSGSTAEQVRPRKLAPTQPSRAPLELAPSVSPHASQRSAPVEPIQADDATPPVELVPTDERAAPPVEPRADEGATPPMAGETSAPPLKLSGELELLKNARAALRAGESAPALALLDRYERARSGNGLAAEATLLRIEALDALGRRRESSELARRFVRENPNSALGDRAKSFIDRTPP